MNKFSTQSAWTREFPFIYNDGEYKTLAGLYYYMMTEDTDPEDLVDALFTSTGSHVINTAKKLFTSADVQDIKKERWLYMETQRALVAQVMANNKLYNILKDQGSELFAHRALSTRPIDPSDPWAPPPWLNDAWGSTYNVITILNVYDLPF